MKKIIVLFGVLIFCCLFSKAQDGKITVDQATYDDMRDKITKKDIEVKALNDSIKNLQKQCKEIDKIKKENLRRTQANTKLDSLNKVLKKQNQKLEKNIESLTGKKGVIKQKNDSITLLTNEITTLRQEKEQDRVNCEKKLNWQEQECKNNLEIEKGKAIDAGRTEILGKIEKYYEQDFEELIAFTSLEIVIRDSAIVKSAKSKDNINKLRQYFLIKESLTLPFNEESNKVAQDQLSSLPKTPSVEKLKETLEVYSICVDELQKYIVKIIELDRILQVNDRSSKKKREKQEEISGYLTEYIVEYEAMNYPYLLNIVLEIMQRKQNNVDAPIEDLYERLSGHEIKRDK